MKVCCIFNFGSHYRSSIYKLMKKEFDCDFYLGGNLESPVKSMDYGLIGAETIHNSYIFGHFYWQRKVLKLLFKPYRYYILIGEPYCLSTWVILLMAKLLNKRTIGWTHGWYGREGSSKTIIKKVFYSLFSELMVYNEYSMDLMEMEGIPRRKMACIANSLDYDQQLEIRSKLHETDVFTRHFKNSNPVLIYIGRIQKSKKIDLCLDAISKLKNKGIEVNFVIVGKDVENVKLSETVESLKLARNVWIYGECYDEVTIGEMLYNASVCVSPGNVGLTAIHALTFGCPVVTHNDFPYQGPEFEAIEKGVTGDFFKENDAESLADTIDNWLAKANKETVRASAYKTIDDKWNPNYQIKVIRDVLSRK